MSVYGYLLKQSGKTVPGLPGFGGKDKRNVGATLTHLGARHPAVVDVLGQPSMKLQRAGQGVVTILRRRSQYAEFLTDAEMRGFEKFVEAKVLGEAKSLARGTLSTQELARRGHPFGRGSARGGGRRGGLGRLQGARTGVSNMAVANRQSGALLSAWSFRISRSKGGVAMELANSSPQSVYLAMGTKRMRAHGPFTTAFARHLPAINAEWARLARLGRKRAMEEGVIDAR